jgi:hypothetical protein
VVLNWDGWVAKHRPLSYWNQIDQPVHFSDFPSCF